jgi:hypothetical protein
MKEITDPAEKGHKKKTKQNQIHKKPTPAGTGKKPSSMGTIGEYAPAAHRSSRGEIREQGLGTKGLGTNEQHSVIDGLG